MQPETANRNYSITDNTRINFNTGFNTIQRPSVLTGGGGDFINSDSGVADADLWTLDSETLDFDSEEDFSTS